MKLTRQDLLFLIIGSLVIWNIITTRTVTTDIAKYHAIIENLQVEIDSTSQLNIALIGKIDDIKDNVIPSISNDIAKLDTNINVIKRQTDEKISSIDTLSLNSLQRYFADRYNNN